MADAGERIASLEAAVEGQARANATLGSMIDQVTRRIDGVEQEMRAGFARLDGRIDGLQQEMHAGFARLDSRIDGLDQKMDAGFARLDGRIDGLQQEMHAGFGQIGDRMRQQFYWIAGFQFTTLLAVIVALLNR